VFQRRRDSLVTAAAAAGATGVRYVSLLSKLTIMQNNPNFKNMMVTDLLKLCSQVCSAIPVRNAVADISEHANPQ
jgi:hypothetical protein